MLSLLAISIVIMVLIGTSHIAVVEAENRFLDEQSCWPTSDDSYLITSVRRVDRDRFPLAGGATGEGGLSSIAPFAPLSETVHSGANSAREQDNHAA